MSLPLGLLLAAGAGAVLAGVSAVLLTNRPAGRAMLGGALAFVALVLALACAEVLARRTSADSAAEQFLNRMIERETE